MIENRFTLELTKNGVQKTIYAKSGEFNSRKVVITLTESGRVFDSHLYVYRAYCRKEDSTEAPKYWDEINVVNGCIEFLLPDEWLVKGDKVCELKVYSGTASLFSPLFRIVVDQSLGESAEAIPTGKDVRYQEALPDLPEGSAETGGEVAVFNPEENQVRRVRLSEIVVDETDPTVPAWAKQASPPSYTAEDVGALPSDTFIPTKVSQLTNDRNFVTDDEVDRKGDKLLSEVPNRAEVDGSTLKLKRDDTELFEVELPSEGDSIGTSNLQTKDVILDRKEGWIDRTDFTMTIESSMLPLNARVKRVDIPNFVSVDTTDEYLALEDMIAKDPEGIPYFIMYPKNMMGLTDGPDGDMMTVVCKVVFPLGTTNNFYSAVEAWLFMDNTIKIYYEIEEN